MRAELDAAILDLLDVWLKILDHGGDISGDASAPEGLLRYRIELSHELRHNFTADAICHRKHADEREREVEKKRQGGVK